MPASSPARPCRSTAASICIDLFFSSPVSALSEARSAGSPGHGVLRARARRGRRRCRCRPRCGSRACFAHEVELPGVAGLRQRFLLPLAHQRGGAGTWSPTTIHNISPAAFHILWWQPRVAQYRGLPTNAHSVTIPVAEALMSRYRESGAVAIRPMSEVHLRLSLARPVALDPIVTVREAGRFTLINTSSGLLKLTNADSERRRLVQRPGLCLCRRD